MRQAWTKSIISIHHVGCGLCRSGIKSIWVVFLRDIVYAQSMIDKDYDDIMYLSVSFILS